MSRSKTLLLCGLALIACFSAYAQSKIFTRSESRIYTSSVALGTKVFFVKGPGIDAYNESDGTWTELTLPHPLNTGRAVTAGGKVFFTGDRGFVDVYDDATGSWSEVALSDNRESYAVTTFGTKVFFAGGGAWVSMGHVIWVNSAAVDIFDTSTSTLITQTLPQSGNSMEAITIGDKIIFGNAEITNTLRGATRTDQVSVYNTTDNSWSTTTVPENGSFFGQNVAIGNKVFFSGQGYDASGTSIRLRKDFTARFVTETNSWTDIQLFADTPHFGQTVDPNLTATFTPYGSLRSRNRRIVVVGDRVLFFGGLYGAGNYTPGKRLYAYNNTTDKLTEVTLTTAFSTLSLGRSGNKIYLTGPEAGGVTATTGVIEVYSADSLNDFDLLVNQQPFAGGLRACFGKAIPLQATGAYGFAWAFSAASSLSATTGSTVQATPTPPPANSGLEWQLIVYSVTATDAQGFSATRNLTAVVYITPAKPTITLTFPESGVPLLTSSATTGNQWYSDDVIVSGATATEFSVSEPGNYTVNVTSSNGCTSPMSEMITLVITEVSNFTGQGVAPLTRIYPNPVDAVLNVHWNGFHNDVPIDFAIVDLLGHRIFGSTITTSSTSFDVSSLPPGMYLVNARQGVIKQTLRLMK